MPSLVPEVVPSGRLRSMVQPELAAGEFGLRPFVEADAEALVHVYADREIQQWHARTMTPDEARQWISDAGAGWAREASANWAVVDATDELIGRAGLREIKLADGVAEVAYWTAPDWRGRGVATTAVQTLARWGFEDIGLHRLEINHSVMNEASCRVAVGAAFIEEGTRRHQALHPDGWHDMHVHGRLSPIGG